MPQFKLVAIPEPAPGTRSVLAFDCALPCVRGRGDRDYLCAGCGKVLLTKMDRMQVQNIVFGCPCGTFNEIPRAHQTN